MLGRRLSVFRSDLSAMRPLTISTPDGDSHRSSCSLNSVTHLCALCGLMQLYRSDWRSALAPFGGLFVSVGGSQHR